MSWTTAVVLIVAMTTIPAFLASWGKAKRHKHSGQRDERTERELAELRDRVETLERIVTDGRYTLDQEFERLEDGGSRRAGRGPDSR